MVRAERATRTTGATSNGTSRSSMAAPIDPYPTMRTVRSASAGRNPPSHSPRSCARTKSGMPRSDARMSASVSSAVLASCTPRALHSRTPAGRCRRPGSTWSMPAERVWTTCTERIPGSGRTPTPLGFM
ncbi:hypothetical protein STENM223S_08174 [Streptomyces tendae]